MRLERRTTRRTAEPLRWANVIRSARDERNEQLVLAGMTITEVERLIGPPEGTWNLADRGGKPGEIGARWSHSPHDANYRCRVLLFRNGRVFEKHSEFYVD